MAHDEDVGQVGRRSLLKTAAALGLGTISARGIYEALGDVVRPTPAEAATVVRRLQEQYLVEQIEVIVDNQQTVAIPPIFNDVFTAKVKPSVLSSASGLKAAKTKLENALVKVEGSYPDTAAGLTMVIAWGLPYFRSSLVTGVSGKYLPKLPDGSPAILDAIKFDSDPVTVALESNDVVFKFRSDKQSIVQAAEAALFDDPSSGAYVGDLFDLTSKRMGFLGRGFGTLTEGKKRLQTANAGLAALIPDRAQLMMGFTSTQTQALGPDNIPSFETLKGATDQWPAGYFAAGCAMHLSHLYIDLDNWYKQSYTQRVQQMFAPTTPVPADATVVTIPNGSSQVASLSQVQKDAAAGKGGHNSLLQQATRLAADQLDNYGRLRRKGTGIPLREDFNTLDNPFAWASPTSGITIGDPTTPGLHFVAFVPSHAAFHKARKAMDGFVNNTQIVPAATAGINSMIHASHRQNFVVPPRKNRSFPLAELL